MKKILFLLFFLNCFISVFAQDLIVTKDGDSINCKITKITKDNIYFTFRHKNEIRHTLLPVTELKDHQSDYFQVSDIPKEKQPGKRNYPHIRIAFNGGYGYRTSGISSTVPSDFRDYTKELFSGYQYGGDFTYYFSETLGMGLKYSSFNASNSLDNVYVEDSNGNRRYGKMSDAIKISFVGPGFSTRFLNRNKKNAFLMNMALGYMGYKNNFMLVDPYKMNGSTMGIAFDFGYDFTISKNLILGAQISAISGVLTGYQLNDGNTTQKIDLEKENYEGLNRIEISVGVRFSK